MFYISKNSNAFWTDCFPLYYLDNKAPSKEFTFILRKKELILQKFCLTTVLEKLIL